MSRARALLVVGLLTVAMAAFGLTASSAQVVTVARFDADLTALNDSGASGTATVEQENNTITVSIDASGLTPDQPHAQHLHGLLDGSQPNRCPTEAADTDGDGFVSTAEGVPAYGPVQVALTTSGDTSADSGLAVDRFPVADANGDLTYQRTFEVSDEVAAAVGDLHIVQHGIDINDNGTYDGDQPSSLDPDLPFEATVPATCGALQQADAPEQPTDGARETNRLSGQTRIETAVEISQFQFPDGADTVFLSRQDEFADALAGGVLTQGPILLVPTCGDLPAAVADEIARVDPDRVIALGGTNAVCDAILQAAGAA